MRLIVSTGRASNVLSGNIAVCVLRAGDKGQQDSVCTPGGRLDDREEHCVCRGMDS